MNIERVQQHIIDWLKDYAEANNRKGFVVDLKDNNSALVAILCKHTLLKTYCVFFDEEHTFKYNSNIASFAHQNDLTVFYRGSSYPDIHEECDEKKMVKRNLVSAICSGIAESIGAVVVGSLDKTQSELIYAYSKYRDRADLEPIIDLYQTEIRAMFKSDLLFRAYNVDISMEELEWASKEEAITQNFCNLGKVATRQGQGIITSTDDPAKNPLYVRYNSRQKQVISKMHQLNKTNKHRETNAVCCFGLKGLK